MQISFTWLSFLSIFNNLVAQFIFLPVLFLFSFPYYIFCYFSLLYYYLSLHGMRSFIFITIRFARHIKWYAHNIVCFGSFQLIFLRSFPFSISSKQAIQISLLSSLYIYYCYYCVSFFSFMCIFRLVKKSWERRGRRGAAAGRRRDSHQKVSVPHIYLRELIIKLARCVVKV